MAQSRIIGNAAVRAAATRHYHHAPRQQSRVIIPPRQVFEAGPVLMVVHPLLQYIQNHPADSGYHLAADHHDPVAVGTEMVLVLIVVVIGLVQVVVRLVAVPAVSQQPET